MYKYELWYDGGLLRDSGDLGYIYETEEEANEEVKVTMEEYTQKTGKLMVAKMFMKICLILKFWRCEYDQKRD